jgi:serpin B
MKKLLCLMLLIVFCLPLHACSQATAAEDLLANITPQAPQTRRIDDAYGLANARFSIELLKNSYLSGENCVLSPYSVLSALAMTANGANCQTLSDFESMFGLPMTDLNSYLARLPDSEELNSANAIWVQESFDVRKSFLQTAADYYDAAVRRGPFNEETRKEINAWVSEQTKERIPELLDRLDPSTRLCLLNALAFDAKWREPYEEYQVVKRTFTAADGSTTETDMLIASENRYLQTQNAVGFCKGYKGNRYEFFALLPDEGLSMEDFLSTLSGEALHEALESMEYTPVDTTMPKLKLECGYSLIDALVQMGLSDAFTDFADFSAMSENPLKIDSVIHRVYFELDEGGTKAAAATAVIMTEAMMAEPDPIVPKQVHLLRPYVMGIYDREYQTILFLGVINQVT